MTAHKDRRVQRTRMALLNAFKALVLEERKTKITVPDVIARANVGRSTFYDHFKSIDDLHLHSLSHPLAILVGGITGSGDVSQIEELLTHFWENRRRARATFNGPGRDQVTRLLADMLEPELPVAGTQPGIPNRLMALQLAENALALIRGWVGAEAWCEPAELARHIKTTSVAILGCKHTSPISQR